MKNFSVYFVVCVISIIAKYVLVIFRDSTTTQSLRSKCLACDELIFYEEEGNGLCHDCVARGLSACCECSEVFYSESNESDQRCHACIAVCDSLSEWIAAEEVPMHILGVHLECCASRRLHSETVATFVANEKRNTFNQGNIWSFWNYFPVGLFV